MSSPQALASPGPRYHSLDGVRGFAMLLGIGLHASLPYIYQGFPWFVADRARSGGLTLIVFTVHAFRMPVFFLVAGFFARLLFLRLGLRMFWRHRVMRIALPLVVGWVVLYPLMRALWVVSMVSIHHPGSMVHLLRGLSTAFSARYLHRGLSFLHLWFLYYLLVLYALTLGLRAILTRLDVRGGAARHADRCVGWALSSRWATPLLALLTTPILLLMKAWGVDLPDHSLVPRLSHLLLYGLFFLVGWWLHRQPHLLNALRSRWSWHAGIAVLALLPEIWMLMWIYAPPHPVSHAGRVAFFVLYALITWGGVLAVLGGFEAWLRRERRGWRYLSDASYWLYLVHLPAVVAVSVLLRPLAWSPWLKLLVALGTTSPVLLLSYHFLVRPTWVGQWLNGRRYSIRTAVKG